MTSPSGYGTFPHQSPDGHTHTHTAYSPDEEAIEAGAHQSTTGVTPITSVKSKSIPTSSSPTATAAAPPPPPMQKGDDHETAKAAVRSSNDDLAVSEAIEYERSLTFSAALKLYPTAVGWSLFVSIGVIMLAFDPQIVGNMFAIPQFKKDFGVEHPNGEVRWENSPF
jgi:hypothetical protein